jgi:hypothetical protein
MAKTKQKNTTEINNELENNTKNGFFERVFSVGLNKWQLLIMLVVLTAIHFGYSYLSTGMLQGDEGVQYMNMKSFWNDHNVILGNWAKPGWKIFYVIPALGGFKFLMLYNSLISASCGVLAYSIAKLRGVKYPLIAPILLLSQFLWIELAFRNYSEMITALFLISAVYFHYKNKFILAALFLSYCLIVRQEMIPVVGLYFIFLLIKKKWLSIIALGTFPFLINFWGWMVKGDPLYLLNEALATSQKFKDMFPRQGFDHYFRVATPIFGVLCVLGLLAYIGLIILRKRKIDYFIFVPAILFFLFHSIFQWQGVKIGTSTGGNWRYLLVISPLIAVLAAIGWTKMQEAKNKLPFIFLLLFYLVSSVKYLAFNHNYVLFKPEQGENWILPIAICIGVAFFFLPKSKNLLLGGLFVLTTAFNLVYLKPLQIDTDGENYAVREFVNGWAKENKIDKKPIYATNAMINFYWDKNDYEFGNGYYKISEENVEAAPVGSYMIWDSHYTKRRFQLDYDYFAKKPQEYKLVNQTYVINKKNNQKATLLLVFKKIK